MRVGFAPIHHESDGNHSKSQTKIETICLLFPFALLILVFAVE